MATIKGKWTFNDTLVGVHDAVSNQINVEFTIQDHELDPNLYQPTFYAFSFDMVDFIHDRLCYIFASKADGSFIQYNAYTEGVWATAGGKPANKIDFGEVEQTVPDEFYTWFIANATPQEEAPTAESVKAKLQALISAANAKTSKNDTNLTDAVNTLMAGYGQGGECDGKHIIEVEELPEVGEKGVIYKIEKKDLVALSMKNEDGLIYPDAYGIIIFAFGGITLPDEFYNYVKVPDTENFIQGAIYYVESEDAIYSWNDDEKGWVVVRRGEGEGNEIFNGTITSIDQITTDALPGVYAWIKSEYEYYEYVIESFKLVQFKADSFQYLDSIFPIVSVPTRPVETANIPSMAYYVEDEDAFLTYDSETGEWKSFQPTEGEDLNIIDDISKITEDGQYIVRSGKFVKYANPVDTQTITEPGLYNVEDKKAVNVAYDSVCGSWKLSGTTDGLADGTTYNVKFTTVHEGNVVNCIGMRFVIELMDGDTLYYILEDGSEIQVYTMGNYTASDTSNYEYVDFGKELQTVPLCFAKFIKSGTPTYDLFTTVDELPEVGENGKVYKCQGRYYEYSYKFYDVAVSIDGVTLMSYRELAETQGLPISYVTAPTKTAIGETPSDMTMYYVEDEEDIYVLSNDGLTLFSTAINKECGGIINDISLATNLDYYYIIFESKWTTYPSVSGTLNIVENGEHDVADFEKVNVDIPNNAICGTWNIQALSDIRAGYLPVGNHYVNFTTVWNGEVKKCIGIRVGSYGETLWYLLEGGGEIGAVLDLQQWFADDAGNYPYYVDFGEEPQLISTTLANLFAGCTPTYKIVPEDAVLEDDIDEIATEVDALNAIIGDGVVGGGDNDGDEGGATLTKLAAPTIYADGNLVKGGAVENASGYELLEVNGEEYTHIDNQQIGKQDEFSKGYVGDNGAFIDDENDGWKRTDYIHIDKLANTTINDTYTCVMLTPDTNYNGRLVMALYNSNKSFVGGLTYNDLNAVGFEMTDITSYAETQNATYVVFASRWTDANSFWVSLTNAVFFDVAQYESLRNRNVVLVVKAIGDGVTYEDSDYSSTVSYNFHSGGAVN